jgi:hypothetical protein
VPLRAAADTSSSNCVSLDSPARAAGRISGRVRVRHVLTHGDGIVDERFLTQVPNSPLKDSQRLVIRRADAEAALGDLAALVRGLAAS